jgi:hypothetical protein
MLLWARLQERKSILSLFDLVNSQHISENGYSSFLQKQKKDCFQQCTVISLLI